VAVIVVDMQNDFGAEGGMFAPSESGFVSAAPLVPSGSRMNGSIERSEAMWT
jgi:nicotinamidase-related amidase